LVLPQYTRRWLADAAMAKAMAKMKQKGWTVEQDGWQRRISAGA